MGTSQSTLKRWDTSDYMRMAHVEGRANGDLEALFADGSKVHIAGPRLVSPDAPNVRWEGTALGEGGYDIVVPRDGDEALSIPWDVIRCLTDRDFAAHMAQAAENQARFVGVRIKQLRKARGLTAREVAGRAGITPESMYRIEHGKHDFVLTTLGKILAAMGYDYSALVQHDAGDDGGLQSEDATNPPE